MTFSVEYVTELLLMAKMLRKLQKKEDRTAKDNSDLEFFGNRLDYLLKKHAVIFANEEEYRKKHKF